MANFCNQCGAPLAAGARFCTKCGTESIDAASAPVAAPPPPAAPQPPYYSAPPSAPARNQTPWIIAGVAVVALLGALAYVAFGRGEPEATPVEAPSNATAAADTAGEAVGPEVIKYLTTDANIRTMATVKDTQSKVVGTLKRGAQIKGVMHTGLSGDTHWFKLSDGRGFVSAVNLADAAPGPAAAPVVATRQPVPGAVFCSVTVSSGNLRVRAAPNGRIVGGMPRGASFQAFNGQNDDLGTTWVQIQPVETRYPNGWVSSDHIKC